MITVDGKDVMASGVVLTNAYLPIEIHKNRVRIRFTFDENGVPAMDQQTGAGNGPHSYRVLYMYEDLGETKRLTYTAIAKH